MLPPALDFLKTDAIQHMLDAESEAKEKPRQPALKA
jgi:hypothetical protein